MINKTVSEDAQSYILSFFRLESFGGILLMASALLAMALANSPLNVFYQGFLDIPVETRFGPLIIAKPLALWINDGLMAVFFFLVGLELKRELVEGELSDPRNIILPGVGAIGYPFLPLPPKRHVSLRVCSCPFTTNLSHFPLSLLSSIVSPLSSTHA